ncbi:MAG: hypothetical protein KME20_00130 [Kaiparowitsia implicata GSE-PSE-MK54-09C]|jgi:hypothetical protein|nr:hypothetical protein [Kaiparowitsia implicata GSE-PSE-MK54-09C]
MKHAGEVALNQLEDVLIVLRQCIGLTEKKRGTFYRKSSAFLHFHEDENDLYADLKVKGEWQRFIVNTQDERSTFVAAVRQALQSKTASRE